MDFVWIALIMIFSHQSTPTDSVYKTGCIARSVFTEAQAMVAGGLPRRCPFQSDKAK